MPASAIVMRWAPSNWNGLVTTPTVRAPLSRAICATTGAAPVPVPPPIPAVMNTMWLPWMCWRISSLASSAAARPMSGREPAPRPWVIPTPSWMRASARDSDSDCASVLVTTKSTPSSSALIHVVHRVAPGSADTPSQRCAA